MKNKKMCPSKTDGLTMKYFTLNPTKDNPYGNASRRALSTYAFVIREENPKLSADLEVWIGNIKADIKNGRLDARDGL
jgi:hypothetical protein